MKKIKTMEFIKFYVKELSGLIIVLSILIGSVFLESCDCTNGECYSDVGQYLMGDHNLKELSYGYYKYFGKDIDGTKYIDKIEFLWQDSTKNYIPITLPVDKIRLEVNDSLEIPYAKFRWRQGNHDGNKDKLIEHVVYVVICGNSDDIPITTNITLKEYDEYLDLIKQRREVKVVRDSIIRKNNVTKIE